MIEKQTPAMKSLWNMLEYLFGDARAVHERMQRERLGDALYDEFRARDREQAEEQQITVGGAQR